MTNSLIPSLCVNERGPKIACAGYEKKEKTEEKEEGRKDIWNFGINIENINKIQFKFKFIFTISLSFVLWFFSERILCF